MLTKNYHSLAITLSVVLFLVCSCMSLQKVSIANMRLEYDKKQLRIKGSTLPIGVSVITNEQKRLQTRGFSQGKLAWSNFIVSVDGGSFSNGKITIPKDSPSDTISIKISSKHHPEWVIREVIWLNRLLSMKIDPVEPIVWATDETFKMKLDAYYDNGQVYNNKLNNKLIKQMGLGVDIEGGTFSGGKFRIFEDFEQIPLHTVSFRLFSLDHPEIGDLFTRKLNYIKHYNYSSSVISGWNGSSGRSGSSGSNGSTGSHGGDGSHGEDGQYGDDGKRGCDLEVFMDAYPDSILQTDLVYVEVKEMCGSALKHYLVNPAGGNISIRTYGGDGGSGGSGGSGGNGGNGGNGKEIRIEYKDSTGTHYHTKLGHGGRGGNGGNGGYGGPGGDGGAGGDIYVQYTSRAKPYLSMVNPQSIGGDGGNGGSGGSAGSGGSGGSGDPSGSSGQSGSSGSSGISGSRGPEGRIVFTLVEN